MSKNPIQFQKGLSLPEFMKQYGTQEQCRQALFELRWKDGFVCPKCGHTSCYTLKSRHLYQCHACRHQVSVTAGTVFASTKLPLTLWFLAMYRMTQNKNGISALALSRELGVNEKTGALIKHKLMETMKKRDEEKQLSGRIEMDDAYLGGEKEGKPGRGSPNKIPFIAVVETTEDKRPRRVQLRVVSGFRSEEVAHYATSNLSSESKVWSDGLACFKAVKEAGCDHIPIITGGGRESAKSHTFKWVNTLLGNVKSALTGTYHAVRKKYAQRYLSEFEYRFNRRNNLPDMIPRLVYAATHTSPLPRRILLGAEDCG